MLTITTANVNGIRAAYRKGMGDWVDAQAPDVLLLQEVRAPDDVVHDLLGPDWHVVHQACDIKGRAGVAIASRLPLS
ncbi:MAG: endonuclease/exonuclease/phosphatase family protein, partial [Cellulomonadaceae bacterium]